MEHFVGIFVVLLLLLLGGGGGGIGIYVVNKLPLTRK